jgi:hypothetical protein
MEKAEPYQSQIVYNFISKLPLQAKASFNIHTKVHRGEIKKKDWTYINLLQAGYQKGDGLRHQTICEN